MTTDAYPVFEEADGWYTVTLGALLPGFGEGPSEGLAMKDLAEQIWTVHNDLHRESDDRLAPHLQYQRDFLCILARAFGKHS